VYRAQKANPENGAARIVPKTRMEIVATRGTFVVLT
jgi:hypothetical protein